MNRSLARRLPTLVLVVVSLASALPRAEARSFARQAVHPVAESWMSALTSWIGASFSNPSGPAARSTPAMRRKTGADLGLPIPLPPINLPIGTGLCIDPNGHPIGCNQG